MVRDIEWGALISQLHDFPLRYALASLLIFSVAMALRAYRWHVLFLGEKVPLLRLLLVQNAGIGINSLSPIRVISEVVQFLLSTFRYPVKKDMVAATLGVQRILDFVIGALLLGVGLLLLPGLKGFALYVLGAGVLAIVSLAAVRVVIWIGTRPGFTRLPLLASTSWSLRSLVQARLNLTFSFLLTLAYWLTAGLVGLGTGLWHGHRNITIVGDAAGHRYPDFRGLGALFARFGGDIRVCGVLLAEPLRRSVRLKRWGTRWCFTP